MIIDSWLAAGPHLAQTYYTLNVTASGHIVTNTIIYSFGEEKLLEFTFSESRSYFRREAWALALFIVNISTSFHAL